MEERNKNNLNNLTKGDDVKVAPAGGTEKARLQKHVFKTDLKDDDKKLTNLTSWGRLFKRGGALTKNNLEIVGQ